MKMRKAAEETWRHTCYCSTLDPEVVALATSRIYQYILCFFIEKRNLIPTLLPTGQILV
jgi:hypothetical protein